MKKFFGGICLFLTLLNGQISADLFDKNDCGSSLPFNQMMVDGGRIFVSSSLGSADCISAFDDNGNLLWEEIIDVNVLSWKLAEKYLFVQGKNSTFRGALLDLF